MVSYTNRGIVHDMGRPADLPGKPRTVTVTVRLTPEGLATIDRLRGTRTRSEFVRDAIRRATEERRTR